jgi:hypothetical protein
VPVRPGDAAAIGQARGEIEDFGIVSARRELERPPCARRWIFASDNSRSRNQRFGSDKRQRGLQA